jgi:hypothetical protein
MVNRVVSPSPDRPLVNNGGFQSEQCRFFLKVMADRSLIIGSGGPEGVIEALQGTTYMDEDGALGNVLYIKQKDNIAGDKSTGWVLIG